MLQLMPFLKEMQKQGFLQVKETAKGVHSVTEINPAHSEYVSHGPYSKLLCRVTFADHW